MYRALCIVRPAQQWCRIRARTDTKSSHIKSPLYIVCEDFPVREWLVIVPSFYLASRLGACADPPPEGRPAPASCPHTCPAPACTARTANSRPGRRTKYRRLSLPFKRPGVDLCATNNLLLPSLPHQIWVSLFIAHISSPRFAQRRLSLSRTEGGVGVSSTEKSHFGWAKRRL